MRKFKEFGYLLASISLFGLTASQVMAQPGTVLVRATAGGSFAEALGRICDEPFTAETGIIIQPVNTDDSAAQIRAQMLTGNVIWDISNTSADTIFTAATEGWLEELDWSILDPDHLLPDVARHPYGIGINSFSETLIVRTDLVPEGKTMSSWEDFWDIENFPGPRSLRDMPAKNLEFALIADGADPSELYDILATDEGVERALAKLDEIKSEITVWWTTGQQPLQLLASGEVFYATGWNGRVTPLQREGVPVEIVWNGGALILGFHSILKGSQNVAAAHEWLKYCWTDAERGAAMTIEMAYPGFAAGLLELLPEEIQPTMPTYPANAEIQYEFDGDFWAEHRPRIQRSWDAWRLQ